MTNKSNLNGVTDFDLIDRILHWVEEKRKNLKWWQRILFDKLLEGLEGLVQELKNRLFQRMGNLTGEVSALSEDLKQFRQVILPESYGVVDGEVRTPMVLAQELRYAAASMNENITRVEDLTADNLDHLLILKMLHLDEVEWEATEEKDFSEWIIIQKKRVADRLPF